MTLNLHGRRARVPHATGLARLLFALSLLACALPARADAAPALGDPRPRLEVARSSGARDCPDAPKLAAAVSRALGRDALDPTPGAAPVGETPLAVAFDVVFARFDAGYVATVRRNDPGRAARTLGGRAATCDPLAEAVVVTLALMLDELDREPPAADPSAAPPPPAPAALPASPPPAEERDAPAAQDAREEPPPERVRKKTRWYGWQTLVVDAGATALLAAGVATSSKSAGIALGVSGLAGYTLGPAIVHAAHDRLGVAGLDVGIRLGAAVVGGIAGALVGTATGSRGCSVGTSGTAGGITGGCSEGGLDAAAGAGLGVVMGMSVASAIDAAALAYEPVHPKEDSGGDGVAWYPLVVPGPRGATFGVGARF